MGLGRASIVPVLLATLAAACSSQQEPHSESVTASREDLLDPETCRGCHPTHYAEWAGSMHAYASFDPVFLAMNRKGQRDTGGALGSFCVSCHAPLALREGATADGLDLEQVPKHLQGVTCYFCHNAEAVQGDHNNPVRLADDSKMRGGLEAPVKNRAHGSSYSELLHGTRIASATLCGSCHDVKLPSPPAPAALHLERTYAEWQGSIFAPPQAEDETAALSCNGCHMLPTAGVAVAENLGERGPLRSRHAHTFAGVDVALTPFPDTGILELDQQSSELQRRDRERLLDATLRLEVCVTSSFDGQASLQVTLDNATAGHHFPSGAAQDRRTFVEVRAFAAGESEPFYASGEVDDQGVPTDRDDPDLWLLRDRLFDAEGEPVHQFWEAAEVRPGTLPVATSLDPLSPGFVAGHASRRFPLQGQLQQAPERVTVRVRLVPIGREVLDELVDSGDLTADTLEALPVHTLLPNRHLGAPGTFAELATLGSVSFEWGPATREHGNFHRTKQTSALGVEECIGMPGRPR
jgi:hypothetical protein